MKQIIFISLLFSQIILAQENSFFHHIDPIQNINFDKISSLSQYEHNTTQKRIKNEIEASLPSYLTVKNLSKDFTSDNYKYISAIGKFLQASSLYINLTSNKELLEKNLQDLNELIINSQNIDDYSLAIWVYVRYFKHTNLNKVKFKTILKRNPIPSSDIYFKHFEANWQKTLKEIIPNIKQMHFKTEDEKKEKMYFIKILKSEYEHYKNDFLKIVKENNITKLKKWNEFIETERVKSLQYIENEKYKNLKKNTFKKEFALVLNKPIVLLMISGLSIPEPSYFKHEQLIKKYKSLIAK